MRQLWRTLCLYVGRAIVRALNREGLDVVLLLRWTREKPSKPGYYWVRAPHITPRVEKIYHAAHGLQSADFYAEWLHGTPIEYAGPLVMPEVRDGG